MPRNDAVWFCLLTGRVNHYILKLAEVPMDIVALGFNVDALTLFKSVLSLLISY